MIDDTEHFGYDQAPPAKETPNPQAFPGSCTSDGYAPNYGSVHEGMTLRDYFAAAALTALLSEQILQERPENFAMAHALAAYNLADAMLIARAK